VKRAGILQSKKDNACPSTLGKGRNLSEIQIKGDDDAVFTDRLFEDLSVRHPVESLVSQVDGIMTLLV